MLKYLFAAAIAVVALNVPAEAKAVKLGTLTCDVEGGYGAIIGSSRKAGCVFVDSKGDITPYEGTITRVGIDVGYTGTKSITWAVLSVGGDAEDLRGTYIGASAEASAGVGLNANALIGGMKNGIVLNPISLGAQTGLNVAAGVTALRLSN